MNFHTVIHSSYSALNLHYIKSLLFCKYFVIIYFFTELNYNTVLLFSTPLIPLFSLLFAIHKLKVLFIPWPVTRFAMHRKTNLLVTSTRSSVCCANLILGFSVNSVHKKHLAERYQWTVTKYVIFISAVDLYLKLTQF